MTKRLAVALALVAGACWLAGTIGFLTTFASDWPLILLNCCLVCSAMALVLVGCLWVRQR